MKAWVVCFRRKYHSCVEWRNEGIEFLRHWKRPCFSAPIWKYEKDQRSGVLFAPVWSTPLTPGVVPHIQLFLKRWSLGIFVLSTFLLSQILSCLLLSIDLLRLSLYTIAITMDTPLLNSLVASLLHWEELVRLVFLHSLILSLSNSPAPDLTARLNLTCTLLVKSATHSLCLFSNFLWLAHF